MLMSQIAIYTILLGTVLIHGVDKEPLIKSLVAYGCTLFVLYGAQVVAMKYTK